MIEKQINHSIVFLDVFFSGIDNQNLTLQSFNKLTLGLLLNFKNFTSFLYKISLIKCLIDRSFKICNNWNYFHNDIENIKYNLIKNAYPPFLINKVIKNYCNYKFSSNQNQLKDTTNVHYFKACVFYFLSNFYFSPSDSPSNFSFSRYSDFCISIYPSFSPCRPLL